MNEGGAGHISIEQLQKYIQNGLDELEREQVDQELLDCEQCLMQYMAVLEDPDITSFYSESSSPDWNQLEEKVIGLLPERIQDVTSKKRRSWLQHPVTHYTIAASITLLLLASGALADFSGKLQSLEGEVDTGPPFVAEEERQEGSTWSDRMLNLTSNWIDGLQDSRFK